MAKALKRGGGPKTAQGKLASSKNAIKHGLTAKHWLNDEEQVLYNSYLEAFTEDFNPQSNIERVMVAQLAECKTRLARIHNAEDAMHQLACEQLDSPEHTIASFQTNNSALDDELNAILYRKLIGAPRQLTESWDLNTELSRAHLSKVSGWNYVCEELPALRHYILNHCEKEQTDVATYLKHETTEAPVTVRIVNWKDSEAPDKPRKTCEELEETAGNVTAAQITQFIEKRLRLVTHDTAVLGLALEFDERQKLVRKTALPETEQLKTINRYRTADQRLFSKTLAELYAIQKHRQMI